MQQKYTVFSYFDILDVQFKKGVIIQKKKLQSRTGNKQNLEGTYNVTTQYRDP